jgi:DDE superfamily endonuclease/Helix-turn-helix of DDE superfamily endonuclease
MLSYAVVKQTPEQFLACTSITVEEFDVLLRSFSSAWDAYVTKNYINAGGGKPKLPHLTDKLFFILFYYKVYPIQSAMGAIFGMSQGQVSFWVGVLSIVLQNTLGIAQCLPNRRPRQLKEALEACGAYNLIIDGTERERQRPSDPQAQKDYYSGKKKAHTYNNIVIVDRDTRTVEYLSQTYEGTWHDKAICDEEQFTFPEQATLEKDRGFQGYEPKGVITYQPKKKPRNGTLSLADKLLNQAISSSRIVVEHVLAGVKRCRIVKEVFRNTRIGIEDRVLAIACGLHNFRQKMRSKTESVDIFAFI